MEAIPTPPPVDYTVQYAGFNVTDVARFLSVSDAQSSSLIKAATGQQVNESEFAAFQSLDPRYLTRDGNITHGLQRLAEHPKGSHYSGDYNISKTTFNIGKALERFFTIRPKSFTAGNLARGAAVGAVAISTGGVGVAPFAGVAGFGSGSAGSVLFQPGAITPISATSGVFATQQKIKIGEVQVTSGTSQHDTSVAQATGTGVYSFGQVQAGNPADQETWYNKIARYVGGASAAYGATAGITSFLSPLIAEGSQVASIASKVVSTTGTGFYTGQVGQVVISLLGRKIGGALLALISRDVASAIRILTEDPPQTKSIQPYGSYGGGGGSGLGIAPSTNTGHTGLNPLWYGVIGLVLILGLFALLRRK